MPAQHRHEDEVGERRQHAESRGAISVSVISSIAKPIAITNRIQGPPATTSSELKLVSTTASANALTDVFAGRRNGGSSGRKRQANG